MNNTSLTAAEQAFIVTIDGPAGAGKSSIARDLAERLGFDFLNTGAMYRAVAWAALRAGVDCHDPQAIASIAKGLQIDQSGCLTLLDGQDITEEIKTNAVSEATRFAADNVAVRQLLVNRQRELAAGRRLVCEGRDQGSVVFPLSPCKIYLTAGIEERARRRQLELADRNESIPLEDILSQLAARDAGDSAREVGPLVKPEDAVELLTDGLSIPQVLERLQRIVAERLHLAPDIADET